MGEFLEHPLTALVVSGLFGAWAMNARPSRRMSAFLFALSWSVGLYGVYEASSYSLWARIPFAVLFTALIALWARWSLVEVVAVELSIACDIVSLPMSYRGDLWILDTIFFHGLGKLSGPKNLEGLWPEDGVKGIGYRCTIKNYGAQPAFGVSLSLDAKVFDWVQTGPASGGTGIKRRRKPQRY